MQLHVRWLSGLLIVAIGSLVLAQDAGSGDASLEPGSVVSPQPEAGDAPPAVPDPPRLSPEEARRVLEQARSATPEPTIAELKQRLFARETEIRRMQEQMRLLDEEIQRLRIENEAMKLALETIRATPIQVNPGNGVAPAPEPEKPVVDEPRWTVQYSLGLIEQGGRVRVVHPGAGGLVFIRDFRDVDRTHVMIRGNFKNESLSPWRYTFEIRIGGKPSVAGRPPKIIGSWRYQTPIMQPGEIHQFEVKVPVSHVAQTQTYEVGNVVADNPDLAPPLEAVVDPDAPVNNGVNGNRPEPPAPRANRIAD